MLIIITVISILLITAFVWLLNKFSPFTICPICAGVSGTWLWILFGIFSGFLAEGDYGFILAMLMGGSVVGIAYQIEKRMPSNRPALLWKSLFIPLGFIGVYSILVMWWFVFLVDVLFLFLFVFMFKFFKIESVEPQISVNKKSRRGLKSREEIEKLEAKMKDCC